MADADARYRPFRPRAARRVGFTVAALVVAALTTLALLLPPGNDGSRVGEQVGIVAFAMVGALVVLRHATVHALPGPDGLVVRNLVVTRRVAWTEIVSVRLGRHRPWVQLDLGDGSTLAVMAIQNADGAFAAAEARRLATLVARHSQTARDD